jgi:hypothetical protein
MNKRLIPKKLRHLIPLVKKWGIENDEYRDNLIYNTLNKQLIELVQNIDDSDVNNLNEWLSDAYQMKTSEYSKFSAFFKAYEYANSLLKIDVNMVPKELHHLIPLVKKWGIGDDGYRDEAVFNADILELEELGTSISDKDANNLDKWLSDAEQIKICTPEYIKFSTFYMAYEYADSILKSRKKWTKN